MGKVVQMPQGIYKVGRDLYEGNYLIVGLGEWSYIQYRQKVGKNRFTLKDYNLDDAHTKELRLCLIEEETLEIHGNVSMQKLSNPAISFD